MRLSHSFSAPAEVVFSTLTDPDRVARWLPDGVRVERAGDVWRVGAGGREQEYRVHRGDLELRWEPVRDGWAGAARVHDGPSGGGVLEVRLTGAPAAADGVLDDVLRRLESEVAENLTAG